MTNLANIGVTCAQHNNPPATADFLDQNYATNLLSNSS